MEQDLPRLTAAEWEIMRVIWTKKKTTSTEVSDIVGMKMDWKLATIKTLLGRLVKKGYLSTTKQGNQFIYSPLKHEQDCLRSEAKELFSKVCDTKKGAVLREWIQEIPITQAELEKLEEVIQTKKKHAPEYIACHCLPGQCVCHIENAAKGDSCHEKNY